MVKLYQNRYAGHGLEVQRYWSVGIGAWLLHFADMNIKKVQAARAEDCDCDCELRNDTFDHGAPEFCSAG